MIIFKIKTKTIMPGVTRRVIIQKTTRDSSDIDKKFKENRKLCEVV